MNTPMSTTHMTTIGAYRADPKGRPKGCIIVIQEIFGVNPHIRSVVDKFAAAGFIAVAPALFDHIESGVELNYDVAGVEKGRALAEQLGFDQAVADVASAKKMIDSSGKVGVVGFCWGGSVAFLCATRLGLSAVSYYGGRTVPFLIERPKAPLMLHFGDRDPLISSDDIAKHRAALPDATIHIYAAGHGFNCDARMDYHAESANLAWQRTLEFFERHLSNS